MKLKTNLIFKNNGFTLVEVLVAMVLLVIMAAAFIPLFTHIIKVNQTNKARLTASNLAVSILEEIKALDYDDIGIDGGNPSGTLEQNPGPFEIQGINYSVHTNVWWVESIGATGDEVTAYKKVEVTVSAPSIFTGNVSEFVVFSSQYSFEGEKTIVEAGHIKVYVFLDTGVEKPERDIRVDVTGSTSPTNWTDNTGIIIFGELIAGEYTVEAKPQLSYRMGKPIGVSGNTGEQKWTVDASKTVTVEKFQTTPVNFEIGVPCYLNLNIKVDDTDETDIDFDHYSDNLMLYIWPDGDKPLKISLLLESNDDLSSLRKNGINEIEFWWNWDYLIKIVDMSRNENTYLDGNYKNEFALVELGEGPISVSAGEEHLLTILVKAATPAVNIDESLAGNGNGSISVALATDTDEAKIYYTISTSSGGADPLVDGVLYADNDKPVLEPDQFLHAIAIKNGLLFSEVVEYSYNDISALLNGENEE